jgi:hypothetical protein|tara:strand:- start:694 stop:1617 length:924 start_codon:yes stop_codon:yes gene_type:complete
MIIDLHPEFGLELALGITYAYWLHERGELEGVRTVKGMKPFYYFCDNVEEVYNHRTIDNSAAGLDELPNNWIHHCPRIKSSNGILDYSKWSVPPYKTVYKTDKFKFDKPMIFVSNRYNVEHGKPPMGYFDIPFLYNIFNYLTENGYGIIYKRPKNSEFPLDQNEANGLQMGYRDISADVDGIGVVTDYKLTEYYEDIILMDGLIQSQDTNTYNETQLQILSCMSGFITMGGGGSLLCSMFGVPNISYFNASAECIRENYFNTDNYYRKMSDHDFYPILDWVENVEKRGYRDYAEIMKKIKEVFNETN